MILRTTCALTLSRYSMLDAGQLQFKKQVSKYESVFLNVER